MYVLAANICQRQHWEQGEGGIKTVEKDKATELWESDPQIKYLQ